jgi:hypothetical protein
MLTVTTAATDRTLLTLAEIQAATGATDAVDAAALAVLNARVAAAIARECCVSVDGVTPPTLRLEVLTEAFRLDRIDDNSRLTLPIGYVLLSRGPIVSITSVVEDGVTLPTDEYEINTTNRRLYRMDGDDERTSWASAKITVAYTAGFATVPDDLKLAASKLARILWTEEGPNAREPGLKRHSVDGVGEREYWVAPNDEPLMSREIAELIAPYMNYANWAV